MTRKSERLRSLASTLLDSSKPAHGLRPEVVELTSLLADSQPARLTDRHDLSEGETRTANGLALSPAMAAMCADDFLRTITFIRGIHAAIVDFRQRIAERPARILYAGCGPYATLAVPLMAMFSSSEASFTLLDLHSESIASAKSVVDTLGLAESVTAFVTQDAGSYRMDSDRPPDIMLVELMQACLEAEPQVAVSRHLLSQAPHSILIPEEVSVDLVLVDAAREFDLDGSGRNDGDIQRDRIPVGQVFVLNRQAVDSWKNNATGRLPGSSVRIPDFPRHRYQPMLFTRIRVYQNQVLKDYDSGLTCPRILSAERPVEPGVTVRFDYQLGSHPRLRYQACI